MLKTAKYAAALTAILGVFAGAWAFADTYGFRPALKVEVQTIADEVEIVARSVSWLQLENYERLLRRGAKLTRRQCAHYRQLAKRLGVVPKPC